MENRKKAGIALFSIGGLLTIGLAVLGGQDEPPSAQTYGCLATFAILAQVGAAWAFGGLGRADPGMAERAISRLYTGAQRAGEARREVEEFREGKFTATDARTAMGRLSVTLSYLEEGYVHAIADWEIFHPTVVEIAKSKMASESEDVVDE